jgi:hypothetical protein
VRTWFQAQLPPKPKEAEHLLTQLELEEGQDEEFDEDMKF